MGFGNSRIKHGELEAGTGFGNSRIKHGELEAGTGFGNSRIKHGELEAGTGFGNSRIKHGELEVGTGFGNSGIKHGELEVGTGFGNSRIKHGELEVLGNSHRESSPPSVASWAGIISWCPPGAESSWIPNPTFSRDPPGGGIDSWDEDFGQPIPRLERIS
ncbi:hypothetical protein DUI87_06802 [Hirundo rustica rustica]|uniref:Uncharacterized protein n=1 Tax=Hirundo rustica rustica TaxID=333673 RepID=A0A3M0KV20_HIRRU|nr:hypothetical protein DUI87_06802 [Hirundo rustica rustica]